MFLLHKATVIAFQFAGYMILDRVLLRGFNTAEVLKNDPKAIAILLGAFSLSVGISG